MVMPNTGGSYRVVVSVLPVWAQAMASMPTSRTKLCLYKENTHFLAHPVDTFWSNQDILYNFKAPWK